MPAPQFMARFTWAKVLSVKSATGLLATLCVAVAFALFLLFPSQYRVNAPAIPVHSVKPHRSLTDSDTANRSFATGAEHTPATTVSRLIRATAERDNGTESVSSLAAILLDPSQPLKVRRQAAWSLGNIGSAEAVAVLRQALLTAPPQLKATIAEALGHSGHPQAKILLASLLRDYDESVVRGAVRGLAAMADTEAVKLLSEIIGDRQRSQAVRIEAALALGEVGTPEAYEPLIKHGGRGRDREIAEALLSGLGRQSFDRTERFFRAYLTSARVEPEMRMLALESLGQTTGNVAPFLTTFLTSEDADLRAAAAWAIANMDEPGDVSRQLIDQLRAETQPEVRTRIYQALENQETIDPVSLLPLIVSDGDTTARVVGMKLLAAQLAFGEGSPALAKQFDDVVVPQLATLSINGQDAQIRLDSVIALRQARTPQALRALDTIAVQSKETQIVRAATLK